MPWASLAHLPTFLCPNIGVLEREGRVLFSDQGIKEG